MATEIKACVLNQIEHADFKSVLKIVLAHQDFM